MSKMILRCSPWLAALTSLFLAVPASAQALLFNGDVGSACVGGSNRGPGGVAIDPTSHNMVVSQPLISQVCILDPSGNQLGILTQADGVTPYPFFTPMGVAIDPDTGLLVVAGAGDGEDPNSGSVTVFNPSGAGGNPNAVVSATQLTLLASDSPGFDTPTGVAIDASLTATRGQIIVVDPSFGILSPAIRAFNAINPGDAVASRNGGVPGSEQILDIDVDAPYDVAIDSSGNAWFGDIFDGVVGELSPGLTNLAFLTFPGISGPIPFGAPAAIAFDPVSGSLAVADVEGDQVAVIFFSPPGTPFTASEAVVRQQGADAGPIARARAAVPSRQHRAAAGGLRMPRLQALAAAAQRRQAIRPACGCGPLTLVAATPFLFTTGDGYVDFTGLGLGSGFMLIQGGQAFFEDPAPGVSPRLFDGFLPLFTVTYSGFNTVLVGDEGGEPLQRFTLQGVDVPTLGGVAALGFAALLSMTALTRLRRRSVER